MKNVLVLGLGGSGVNVANSFFAERKSSEISVLALDSDISAMEKIDIPKICLTDYVSLGNAVEKLGKSTVSDWFPCDDSQDKVEFFKTLEMGKGANGWRMKGLLSFEYMLSDSEKHSAFLSVLDRLIDKDDENHPIEIIIVSSLIGGTGSALFLPVSAFIKRYFRSRYGKEILVKVFLSCPEVYADSLTSENKVKAFANAYAAMAELNAVDLVSKGYNVKAKENGKCKISFKIGSEKSKGIGVLFDSASDEFASPSAMPIDRAYLFDRIPGTDTIAAHERVMTQILSLIVDDEDTENISDIYAGISIAEIVYPFDCVTDYVAKKKVISDIEREWIPLYNAAKKEQAAVFGADGVLDFADSFVGVYKNTYGVSSFDQHLILSREKNEYDVSYGEDRKDPLIPADYVKNYLTRLIGGYQSFFENDTSRAIKKAIESDDKDIRSIGFFDNKTKKLKKIAAVKEKAAEYEKLLTDKYRSGIKICRENRDRINVLLKNPQNADSLFNNIIKYEGEYLHPVTALLLLCELYREIKVCVSKDSDGYSMLESNYDGNRFPDTVIRSAPLSGKVRDEYAKLGATRLKTLADTSADKLSVKIVDAFEDVKKDFIDLDRYLTEKFVGFCLSRATIVIADLIKNYSKLLDVVPSIIDDHRVDVKLALIAGTSDSCTRMNVGVDENVKEEAYKIYAKATDNDFSRDGYTGRLFYDYVENKEDKDGIFDDLVKEEMEKVKACPTIKTASEQDVFRVLHDRDIFKKDIPDKTAYNDFKKALSLVALPLDIANKEDITKDKTKVKTVTLVPTEAAEFARKMLKNPDLSLQEAIDKYLFIQGNFEAAATVSSTTPKNMIFATKKIYDFELYLFNKLNESIDGSNYYKNYLKALGVKKEQSTQMWNPRLVKDKPGDFLPFIDPGKRENFEKNIYKAVLYMLFAGRFFVGVDDGGHDVFFYTEEEKREEVLFEGKRVEYKDPEKLFGFIRENVEFAENFGLLWDKEVEKEISLLPAIGYEKTDVIKLKQAIKESPIVRFLSGDIMAKVRSEKSLRSKDFVDFLWEISDKEDTKAEAVNLGRTFYDLIEEMVNARHISEEAHICLFTEIFDELKDDYERKAKKAGKKNYSIKAAKAFEIMCNG